jgi:hypothetical protein
MSMCPGPSRAADREPDARFKRAECPPSNRASRAAAAPSPEWSPHEHDPSISKRGKVQFVRKRVVLLHVDVV